MLRHAVRPVSVPTAVFCVLSVRLFCLCVCCARVLCNVVQLRRMRVREFPDARTRAPLSVCRSRSFFLHVFFPMRRRSGFDANTPLTILFITVLRVVATDRFFLSS